MIRHRFSVNPLVSLLRPRLIYYLYLHTTERRTSRFGY
nr:MAG TPA: hypothetical protein [Caudoviricetes sp.]